MSVLNEPAYFAVQALNDHAPLPLPQPRSAGPAKVVLVGAGPGDAELLTVKAWRALQCASYVLYDQLVGPDILALLPPTAERHDVGKAAGRHSMPQEAIIDLMLTMARAGQPVLRLKGGDPYIFGRGGEEAQALGGRGHTV